MRHEIDMKKFNIHTDMAIDVINNKKVGIKKKNRVFGGIKVTDILLSNKNKLNKKSGSYVTIEYDDISDYDNYKKVKKIFRIEFEKLLKKMKFNRNNLALIVGLGNKNSTPDSLGAKITENIIATRHIKKIKKLDKNYINVATITPGVEAQTGINSFEVIKAVVNSIKPNFLIVFDSLVTNSINRINKTIQINNVGINPGSGISKEYQEISFDTLKIPVIAIGVPTVLSYDNILVTVKEIDYMIEKTSLLISSAINDYISNV